MESRRNQGVEKHNTGSGGRCFQLAVQAGEWQALSDCELEVGSIKGGKLMGSGQV